MNRSGPPDAPREESPDGQPGIDRFGGLLAASVVAIAGMMLIDLFESESKQSAIASAAVSLVIGATLLLALRASGAGRRLWRIAVIGVVFATLVSIIVLVVELADDSDIDVSGFQTDRPSVLWVFTALVTPFAVIRRLLQHRRVTAQTMAGAIAAYLLIALAYTYLYIVIGATQSEPFFSSSSDQTSTAFAYFSLTTITTLGYGDLAPATDVGRLVATSEAVLGQVYLVTFVAMFVGLFIQHRDGTPAVAEGDGAT